MSFYASDGDIAFGWKSFGRSFTLVGLAAALLAAGALCLRTGLLPVQLSAAGSLLTTFLFWAGTAIFVLMTICGLGSLTISRAERGDVDVSPLGVRRILDANGREEFFPRSEIAGMYARPEGGLALFDSTYEQQMIVPRSIVGYRDCVAELKALGIPVIVPPRMHIGEPYRPKTRWQRIQNYLFAGYFALTGSIAFGRHEMPFAHHLFGVLLLVGILAWIASQKFRKQRSSRFDQIVSYIFLLGTFVALSLRW